MCASAQERCWLGAPRRDHSARRQPLGALATPPSSQGRDAFTVSYSQHTRSQTAHAQRDTSHQCSSRSSEPSGPHMATHAPTASPSRPARRQRRPPAQAELTRGLSPNSHEVCSDGTVAWDQSCALVRRGRTADCQAGVWPERATQVGRGSAGRRRLGRTRHGPHREKREPHRPAAPAAAVVVAGRRCTRVSSSA